MIDQSDYFQHAVEITREHAAATLAERPLAFQPGKFYVTRGLRQLGRLIVAPTLAKVLHVLKGTHSHPVVVVHYERDGERLREHRLDGGYFDPGEVTCCDLVAEADPADWELPT